MTEKTHPPVGVGEKAEPLFKKSWSEVANFVYNADTDGIPASWFDSQWPADFGAGVMDNSNLGASKAASIFDDANLQPVKAADILDHSNLSGGAKTGKRSDIMSHPNLSPSKFNDIVSNSVYGITGGSLSGKKGYIYQIHEEKNFHSITETPNHAYWHRIYNTPAAFETIYQDYTTKLDKHGTTPQKSAPNTADPDPQPGAMWSVSAPPDGTQVGGFGVSTASPMDLTWDGTYLWYCDAAANYIYQLGIDGTKVSSFASPASDPRGIVWDGAYLWNADKSANYVYQLKTDGTQVAGGGFASPGNDPRGLAWDGTYLWNQDNNYEGSGYVYKLKTDGTQVSSFGGTNPYASGAGLCFDGTYLWHSNDSANWVYQLKTDGTEVGNFTGPSTYPRGNAWDRAYLWNADIGADYINRVGNAGNFDMNYRIFAK